jgi:AbrB family looped-hinge helix DNA binding protein
MSVATVTSKGQITLPAELRAEFGIEQGDKVLFYKTLDGSLGVSIIKPRKGAGAGSLRRYADRLGGGDLDELVRQSVDEAMNARLVASRPKP